MESQSFRLLSVILCCWQRRVCWQAGLIWMQRMYAGNRIPDYKAITLRNVVSTTPGLVLIAWLD